MLIVDPGAAIDCVCLFTIRTSHHPLHRNCCSLTNVKIPKGCPSCSADKMWESSDQRELGDGIALIKTRECLNHQVAQIKTEIDNNFGVVLMSQIFLNKKQKTKM